MKLFATLLLSFACLSAPVVFAQQGNVPGADKKADTKALTAGSNIIQDFTPVKQISHYVVGLHPSKANPGHQMIAHHYCHQKNEDFSQCVLFDGNTKDAHLNGIEYIISEKLFQTLPEEEKKLWHPHNYEILSGQLTAPGLPDVAEKAFLKKKMNSYGKTWHVWMTGGPGMSGDKLPLGEPDLAWSFNKDGEAKPEIVSKLEKDIGYRVMDKRKERADLKALAKPQMGEGALDKRK